MPHIGIDLLSTFGRISFQIEKEPLYTKLAITPQCHKFLVGIKKTFCSGQPWLNMHIINIKIPTFTLVII